jgi:transcriptional regulator with XRE-family HTH domain
MAIGQRIKFFRKRKGMTQKQLGELLGFKGRTSDVRMAQYESEARVPKQDLVNMMADILGVAPKALTVPDIDTHFGLLHTLFALEDIYGLKISEKEGEVCLSLDHDITPLLSEVDKMLRAWQKQSAMLENGEISREEYDEWRYTYPKQETYQYKMKMQKEKKKNSDN